MAPVRGLSPSRADLSLVLKGSHFLPGGLASSLKADLRCSPVSPLRWLTYGCTWTSDLRLTSPGPALDWTGSLIHILAAPGLPPPTLSSLVVSPEGQTWEGILNRCVGCSLTPDPMPERLHH